MVDTLASTIELPLYRHKWLLLILDGAQKRTRILVQDCHKLIGKVRSMLLAVSSSAGLLSHLQSALYTSLHDRVHLSEVTC